MKWDPITRRHFLQSSGKAILLLPFLPSLVSKKIFAQEVASPQKTFIGICAYNGLHKMYGPDSRLMPPTDPQYSDPRQASTFTSLPGYEALDLPNRHRIHYKSLEALRDENNAAGRGRQISELIDTSFDPVLRKMALLQGFDYTCFQSYHHNGQFGNVASGAAAGLPWSKIATIDQVMAYSSNFYRNSSLLGSSVSWGPASGDNTSGYESCFTFTNPKDKINGGIQKSGSYYYSPATLWNAFFGGTQASALKKSLIDQVLEDYKSLSSNRRLAAADKALINQQIDLLNDTQKKINALPPACAPGRPASSYTDKVALLKAFNDVIVALAACGLCHSFLGNPRSVLGDGESWHTWSHQGYQNETCVDYNSNNTCDTDSSKPEFDRREQNNYYTGDGKYMLSDFGTLYQGNPHYSDIANQSAYDNLFAHNRVVYKDMGLDLAKKLDAIALADGKTLLDSSLVAIIQEHSRRGHETWNIPIVTFGSAGDSFNTNRYIDFRNFKSGDDRIHTRKGFPINQLWANMLTGMGVPKEEFEPLNKYVSVGADGNPARWNFKPGSGYGLMQDDNYAHYDQPGWQNIDLSGGLPFWKK